MIDALVKAVRQLPQSEIRKALALSMLGALAMIAVCGIVGWLLLEQFAFFGISFIDNIIAGLGTTLFTTGAILLYPTTVMLVGGFFVEKVVEAVEADHYPERKGCREPEWPEVAKSALKLFGMTAILNILMLPVYLIGLFIPGLSLVIYYLVNGYLFGHEFYNIVAARHLEKREAVALREDRCWPVFRAGLIIVVLATIPVVNLAAPIIATAFMVHVFHQLRPR